MSFSVTPLLLHADDVPPDARDALRAAYDAPSPAARARHLESAARILHRAAGLDCSDVRELVGLPSAGC